MEIPGAQVIIYRFRREFQGFRLSRVKGKRGAHDFSGFRGSGKYLQTLINRTPVIINTKSYLIKSDNEATMTLDARVVT